MCELRRCYTHTPVIHVWLHLFNVLAGVMGGKHTFVIAAVNVVLPWSTCPMVPMFKCGLVREFGS